MNQSFSLTRLKVTGAQKKPAEIPFKPGLNVICGASDTGKTYIQECIDFMFGGETLPKEIPQGTGYQNIFLGFQRGKGSEFTLARSLQGGAFYLYDCALDDITDKTPLVKLGARHSATNADTLSRYLLGQIGMDNKRIRKDQYGNTNSLSFRDIAFLTLVTENRIISKTSPLLSGDVTFKTLEESVFNLLLSGTDSSSLIPEEKPAVRKMKLNAQLALVSELLSNKERELEKLNSPTQNIEGYLSKLNDLILQGTKAVAVLQKNIDALDEKRGTCRNTLLGTTGRREFLTNLIGRFNLLAEHYKSDRLRLEATLEAGELISGVSANVCVKCGQSLPKEPDGKMPKNLSVLRAACESEIKKVATLETDLEKTLTTLTQEDVELGKQEIEVRREYDEISKMVENALKPKADSNENMLYKHIQEREMVSHLLELNKEITELNEKHKALTYALKEKRPKGVALKKLGVSDAEEFCEVVQGILSSWKYPNLGRVVWDSEQKDLVIGRQSRNSLGKGYRALTHAAFSIGLMKYCFGKELPHPGMVLLDTPLNPLREAADHTGQISNEMKDAFYGTLASDIFGGQVIVLENYTPPIDIHKNINYLHFSGKKDSGRYGFFPMG